MSYAILRTKKLKSPTEIARVGRHNEREQRTLNADPERTKLNVDYRPEVTGSLIDRVRRRIGNRQHRRDAVLAVEVLLAYSPEAENLIDPLGWGVTSMDWLEAEFGHQNLISAELHRDEKSVHLQTVVVPIDPKDRLNCKHFLGSPQKLAALQTRYAAAVAKFGLKRGEEGSKRKHVPIRDLYRDSNLLKDEAEKAASLIEMLKDPPRFNVPERRTLESHREHEKRVNEFLRKLLLRIWQQLQDALVRLIEAGRNIGILKAERSARVAAMKRSREAEKRAAIAERRVAKAERIVADQAKKIADFEKQLADRCRELPLTRVAHDLLNTEPQKTQGGCEGKVDRPQRYLHFIRRDSIAPATVAETKSLSAGRKTMVIADGDHAAKHVLAEMRLYGPLVSEGCYFVAEDGIVDVMEWEFYTPGPSVAAKEFVSENDEFVIDRSREKFLLTYAPNGFLKRVRRSD